MLNDKEIAWAAASVQSPDEQQVIDATEALLCSTLQAVHSIARSLDVIAEHLTHSPQITQGVFPIFPVTSFSPVGNGDAPGAGVGIEPKGWDK